MRYSKVSNVKADNCDACCKDTGFAGVRYIAIDGSSLYCEACFLAKEKADRIASAQAKRAMAAMLAKDFAAAETILAPIVNHLKATLEVA